MNNLCVIGLMSGTSLDGLDIAIVQFTKGNKWKFKIYKTQTIEYPTELKHSLKNYLNYKVEQAVKIHNQWSEFAAVHINKLLKNYKIDLISSHGHTVLHKPEKGLNLQIGNGAVLAAKTGLPVVCDFRSVDIALNGQGAPLVPVGEHYLFSQYKAFLNLGGFANISIHTEKNILAYDITTANYALNYLAWQKTLEYDKNGMLAKDGKRITSLLNKLNSLPYYQQTPPKSLSDHWFFREFYPQIKPFIRQHPFKDIVYTVYEHITTIIAKTFEKHQINEIFITGGGTKNNFLIKKLKEKTSVKLIIPQKQIIDYKEAIIFAFLGMLRYFKKINIFKSVTGAIKDNIGGAVYFPFH